MRAVVIPADGSKPYVQFVYDGYKQLQGLVGGLIDAVSNDEASAYVNDEGLLIGLRFNRIASIIMGRYLVGDVVVCGNVDDEGYDTDISENTIRLIDWHYNAQQMHDESLLRL